MSVYAYSDVVVQLFVCYDIEQTIASDTNVQTVCKFELVIVWICRHALVLQVAVAQRPRDAQ